jgi:tetratricopeptide (TPR) repeat protein
MLRRLSFALALAAVASFSLVAAPSIATAASKPPSAWSLCKAAAKRKAANDSDTIQKCTAVIDAAAQGDKKAAKRLASARFYRGVAYNGMDENDKALADLAEAVKLRPKFARAWYQRANVYSDKGMLDLAIADYDRVIALKAKHARAFANRCRARALANRELDLALADCNKSLALRPKDNARAQTARGIVYFRKGDYGKALADLNNAVAGLPKAAGPLYLRGIVKLKSGDKTGGDTDIAAAKALDGGIAGRYAAFSMP